MLIYYDLWPRKLKIEQQISLLLATFRYSQCGQDMFEIEFSLHISSSISQDKFLLLSNKYTHAEISGNTYFINGAVELLKTHYCVKIEPIKKSTLFFSFQSYTLYNIIKWFKFAVFIYLDKNKSVWQHVYQITFKIFSATCSSNGRLIE